MSHVEERAAVLGPSWPATSTTWRETRNLRSPRLSHPTLPMSHPHLYDNSRGSWGNHSLSPLSFCPASSSVNPCDPPSPQFFIFIRCQWCLLLQHVAGRRQLWASPCRNMEEPGTQIPSSHISRSEWTLNLGLEVQGFAGMKVGAIQHQVHTRTKFDCVTSGFANEGARQKNKKTEMAHWSGATCGARKNQRDSCEWIEGDVPTSADDYTWI